MRVSGAESTPQSAYLNRQRASRLGTNREGMPARIPGNAREVLEELPRAPWRRAEAGPAGGERAQVAASLARPLRFSARRVETRLSLLWRASPSCFQPGPVWQLLEQRAPSPPDRPPLLEADEGAG